MAKKIAGKKIDLEKIPGSLLVCVFILILLALIYIPTVHTPLTGIAEKTPEDFDYTDLVFKNRNVGRTPIDTNITLINIDTADRAGIDALLKKISLMQPKIIGLDVAFEKPMDADADRKLQQTISSTPNLIIVRNIDAAKQRTTGIFNKPGSAGYTNLAGMPDNVVRNIYPLMRTGKRTDTAFCVKILQRTHPAQYQSFIKQCEPGKPIVINYRRDCSRYIHYSFTDIMTGSPDASSIKGRIVLIGYFNDSPTDIEDKHITPMNDVIVGNTLPDMNGMVINANILSMMTERTYISTVPEPLNIALALTLAGAFLYTIVHKKYNERIFFHMVIRWVEFGILLALVLIACMLFILADIKFNIARLLWGMPVGMEIFVLYETLMRYRKLKKEQKQGTANPAKSNES